MLSDIVGTLLGVVDEGDGVGLVVVVGEAKGGRLTQ